MAKLPRTRLEVFIDSLLGEKAPNAWHHRLRAYVLEQGTLLELDINEVLAASLALNARAADVLISDVLWRLPIPVRLGMLADLMQRKELLDRWPFVIPVLRRFFELRHELAHGLAAPEVSGQTILVATVKRGRGSGRIYRTEQLEWLAWQAHAARIELAHIWAAVASSTKAWYEAGG